MNSATAVLDTPLVEKQCSAFPTCFAVVPCGSVTCSCVNICTWDHRVLVRKTVTVSSCVTILADT